VPANLATDTVRRIAAEGVYCDAPLAKAASRGVNRQKLPAPTACREKDLDDFEARVHLHKIMLIVLNNEPITMRAVFTAGRDRLFDGQHRKPDCGKDALWTVGCSIPSTYSSQGLEPSNWRGS
jgi:hypothetical protein